MRQIDEENVASFFSVIPETILFSRFRSEDGSFKPALPCGLPARFGLFGETVFRCLIQQRGAAYRRSSPAAGSCIMAAVVGGCGPVCAAWRATAHNGISTSCSSSARSRAAQTCRPCSACRKSSDFMRCNAEGPSGNFRRGPLHTSGQQKSVPRKTQSAWWLRGPDLNQRPSGYEPDELPDCSTPRYLLFSSQRFSLTAQV